MMNPQALFRWMNKRIRNYNLFIMDEDDDGDNEQADPATVIKRQKYSTWLYVLLLIGN
jgi:hypothetical protein